MVSESEGVASETDEPDTLEPTQLGRARLLPRERSHRLSSNCCLFCGVARDFIATCPVKRPDSLVGTSTLSQTLFVILLWGDQVKSLQVLNDSGTDESFMDATSSLFPRTLGHWMAAPLEESRTAQFPLICGYQAITVSLYSFSLLNPLTSLLCWDFLGSKSTIPLLTGPRVQSWVGAHSVTPTAVKQRSHP